MLRRGGRRLDGARKLNELYRQETWQALWLKKVVALRIDTANGEVLTEPQQVIDRHEDLDVGIYRFVNDSLMAAVGYLATLGERRGESHPAPPARQRRRGRRRQK